MTTKNIMTFIHPSKNIDFKQHTFFYSFKWFSWHVKRAKAAITDWRGVNP